MNCVATFLIEKPHHVWRVLDYLKSKNLHLNIDFKVTPNYQKGLQQGHAEYEFYDPDQALVAILSWPGESFLR